MVLGGVNLGNTTLTNYTENTFTPALTAATAGDFAPNYNSRTGVYTRVGRMIFVQILMDASPTWTTASGALRITGLPVASAGASGFVINSLTNITFPAGTTTLVGSVQDTATIINLTGIGSAAATNFVQISDIVGGSGANIIIQLSGVYRV